MQVLDMRQFREFSIPSLIIKSQITKLFLSLGLAFFSFTFVYAQENKTEDTATATVNLTSQASTPVDKIEPAKIEVGPMKDIIKDLPAPEDNLAGKSKDKEKKEIILDGDEIEYSTDTKNMSAKGNVVVLYGETRLSCDKLTGNSTTKDVQAEGHVRLDDKTGIIEGEKIIYNFESKKGVIMDAKFRVNPYFGKARKVVKISDEEFLALRGRMTTCDYDHEHYFMRSGKMDMFPNDKVQVRDTTMYIGRIPILYMPQYNHSMRDPLAHVQLMPGISKDWGAFMLTAWRYNVTDYVKGRIYLDFREKLGIAEGLGLNYATDNFGKGDYKFYYTHEKDKKLKSGIPNEFQRYFIRWRHKWNIGERTDLTLQYYKIVDSKMSVLGGEYNVLKDYFYREYESDSQPLSYLVVHHAFNYASLDFTVQKRTNRWYGPGYLEKLPEIVYSMPSLRLGNMPLYFSSASSLGNYNKKNTSTSTPAANQNSPDTHFNRLDTTNKLSLPMKVAFISFTPFVANRQTFYDRGVDGSGVSPRSVFYSGADVSTKFYRIFNLKTDFLKLNIDGLRHVITPGIGYSYNHEPTIANSDLRQIDGVDFLARNNAASLSLSNKLQTKRNGQSVDLLDFRVSSTYAFKPKVPNSAGKRGSSFSDFLFELDLLPYSWMRLSADATYNHYQDYFSQVDADINFNFGNDRSIGFGERYQRKGGKQLTFNLSWRLNPKWKFGVYERYQFANNASYKRGLREQQYFLARDLHCWITELTCNITKDKGVSLWVIFRLKAFPELEFGFDQSYQQPKPGTQVTQ